MIGDWSDAGLKAAYDRGEQMCELIDKLSTVVEENKSLKVKLAEMQERLTEQALTILELRK